MTVNCGNAERLGRRADVWPVTAAASGAVPGDGPGPSFPARLWAGTISGRSRREQMTKLPAPGDALRMATFLDGHAEWSAFWDKHDGVWRVAEDDPSSELYAESADADGVLDYMAAHAQRDVRHDHSE
jgi:hypothetical protein